MSLGKIGKLTNVFNAFKQSPFSNKSDMISSLAAFGNINKAASYLNKVNSDGTISNTASKMLLYKAYAASGITKEEAGEALNNNLAGSSKFGLLGNIKNVGSGIATVFKSIAPMMIPLIIGAVGIKAGKMLWDNVLTDNAAQKNLQESVQKYKTEKSDLDNLQSQKETNKQRVYELRAKSNRTSAEDNELNNLLNEDSILDTQIGLKKRTVTSAQKQQALDAKKALEKRTFQGELFGKSPYPVYQDTNIGYAQKLMSGLEDEKQARKDVLNNKEWSSERKEAELKAKDKTIASYETELADVMSDISSNAQDLYDEDGNLIDKKNTQDLANNINDLFKAYSMLTNSSDYVSDKMDNIFALSKFSNLKDKLIEAGKSGGTDAIKDLISQTKDLDEAMSNAGIDADDLADGIMAIADPDAKNLEGIKDNLKDIFGKKYSFFKDKNDEDIEGFWDYLQDNNFNPEKMKWSKEDISKNWENYLTSKNPTEIIDDTTFASRFKNSAEDTATDLDTITDNFQTDMSNIKSSMDSIKSGTFQNSDITDLIQQFPELATETDNLQQGLQNLAFDKASTAIGKIRDSVKDVTDPKELAAANKYIQSIMDTMDLSDFDVSNSKHTKDTIISTDEKLSPVVDRVSALETAKDDLAGKVETNTTDISGLKTDVAGLKESNETISATTTETKNTVDILKQNVSGYDSQFESINSDITAINESIKDLGKNTGHEYDVSYEENVFTLYEDDVIKKQFTITGGSGPSDTTTVTIERITSSDAIFLAGNSAVIEYNFTSVDNTGDTTGNGTATWRVGSTTVATTVAAQGKNSFDITQYLKNGANSIRLSITDSFGTIATKTWTITIVDFKIESIFDDTLFYSDEVTFRYTPYGDINKTVHFVLDGKEIAGVETTASGRQMTYTLAKQSHGAHLLKVYMTASINNQDVTSESVYKDIIWVEQGNTTPIIGCSMVEFTAKQYNTTSIKYVVYDPEHNPATVKLSVDGKVASTLTVGRTAQIWSYKSTAIGKQSLTISCRRITKILTATIEKLDINVSPVTTNLAFDFNPSGKNNGEADWLKINDNLTIEVSDNFDTTNGGYQVDEDGDTYFCVKAGTAATIPYQLFADDAKKTGKNFKFIYKCTNVKNYEAQVLSCFADNLGYTVKAQEATLKSEQNEISVPLIPKI